MNNNINNNLEPNNAKQKSGYKNMQQPSYHNTHGYDYQNQINNNSLGNNNYNRGYNNQMNNNNYNNNFGGQMNQNNNYNNNQYNNNQNNNYYEKNNRQQFNNNSPGNSNKRSLDDINKEIASLEEEMSVPTLPQYQKAALRKKYHALLVERSKYLK